MTRYSTERPRRPVYKQQTAQRSQRLTASVSPPKTPSEAPFSLPSLLLSPSPFSPFFFFLLTYIHTYIYRVHKWFITRNTVKQSLNLLFSLPPLACSSVPFPSRPVPSSPCHEAAPWNIGKGLGERCKLSWPLNGFCYVMDSKEINSWPYNLSSLSWSLTQ